MKEFTITGLDVFHLGQLLQGYGENWTKFFKVWEELKTDFDNFDLRVIDYKLDMVKVVGHGYKWININCSEQYIREHLLSFLVDDVDEYLTDKNEQPIAARDEEIQMMIDAGLDISMFDL